MTPTPHVPDWVNASSNRHRQPRRPDREAQFRRRRAAAIAGALLLLVIFASISSGGGPRRPSPSAVAANPKGPLTLPPLAESAATLEQRKEGRAIDALLGRGTAIVQQGGGRARDVALTFDDGPSPYTPRLVAELNRLHVPATFFAVGEQETSFSPGTRDALAGGYFVEDHTSTHPFLTHLDAAGQTAEIAGAAQHLMQVGVPTPRLFRPPYGAFDRATLAESRRLNMLSVLWSVDTEDYTRPGVGAIVRRVLAGVQPGAIVLMHDGGGDRSQTVAAVPEIVRALRARGYTPVSVPRMMLDDPPAPGQSISPGFGGAG